MNSREFTDRDTAIRFAQDHNGFWQYCSHESGGVWVVFYKEEHNT